MKLTLSIFFWVAILAVAFTFVKIIRAIFNRTRLMLPLAAVTAALGIYLAWPEAKPQGPFPLITAKPIPPTAAIGSTPIAQKAPPISPPTSRSVVAEPQQPEIISEAPPRESPKILFYTSPKPTSPIVLVEPEQAETIIVPAPHKSARTIYTGPRGGHYHYSASGKKVYERKK